MGVLGRLEQLQLIVVTGKGGVGKSAVSAALGAMLANRGRRVLLIEVDPRENLHLLLDIPPSGGEIVEAASEPLGPTPRTAAASRRSGDGETQGRRSRAQSPVEPGPPALHRGRPRAQTDRRLRAGAAAGRGARSEDPAEAGRGRSRCSRLRPRHRLDGGPTARVRGDLAAGRSATWPSKSRPSSKIPPVSARSS